MAEQPANLLSKESSPYLKLHAEQPVHWEAWNEEAFLRAEREQKPILLSIGYSTCHWCHVMARESFEDHEIAQYLNEHFISIKLDREERPDIDALYMSAHMAMHEGNGGWPLNIFLTPERKPFFSGTYFPPKAKANRAGFDQILKGVHQAWTEKRDQITEFSGNLITQLESMEPESQNSAELGKNFLPHTQGIIRSTGDTEHFGWGRGPKFPQPSLLRFLLLSQNEEDVSFALNTCKHMAHSGLYDHLNGGFHRYCVDREWIVPHFEKMLYDQAQLIEVYLDAYLLSGDVFYATIARDTCAYVLREMRSPSGTFHSAQDAQSEGKEGKFSCWTLTELSKLIPPKDLALLSQHFDLTEEGNFYDFSDPEALKNQNVLVIIKPLSAFSNEEQKTLTSLKELLFKTREQRIPPATDTKVLLSWNALMIPALARTGHILEEKSFLQAAVKAHEALLTSHKVDQDYFHSAKDDQYHGKNLGSDLSCLLYASRTLYHCTLNPTYLNFSTTLADQILHFFHDQDAGGFYETEQDADLIMRLKGDFDNALPTVSSQMVRELSVLSHLTENKAYAVALEKTLKYHQATLQTMPQSLGEMLLALTQAEQRTTLTLTAPAQISLHEHIEAGLQAFPPPLLLSNHPGVCSFYQELKTPTQGILSYLCKDNTCQLPTKSLHELKEQLKRS